MTKPKPYEEADDDLVGGDRGHYTGDIHDNVRHGYGTYVYANTFFKYEGEYMNGSADLRHISIRQLENRTRI